MFSFVFFLGFFGLVLLLEARLGLLGCALHGGSILLFVLSTKAVEAALGSRPALSLEVLLGLHGEGEVLRAALALDDKRDHALVIDRAVVAALGLLPALLLKDARLGIREEEGGLAVATREVGAHRLGGLLCLAAIRAARRLRPALPLKEDLVLAREGKGRATSDARQLLVLGQRRTVALGLLVTLVTTTCRLLALVLQILGLLQCGLAVCDGLRLLLRNVLLQLCDALGHAREELTQPRCVLTDREAAKAVVTVRLGLDEHLAIDERHFV